MPAQFDSFGVRFLYPDNWKVAQRDESDGDQGTTLDLPEGGFLSIDRAEFQELSGLVNGIAEAVASEYEEVEKEEIELDGLPALAAATELRFYYLDLLIVCRVVAFQLPDDHENECLVVQMQAESREFDKNEPVFAAILKQLFEM